MTKQIVADNGRGGNRGYATPSDRKRAIAMLAKRGFDAFTCYRDVQADYALQYGIKTWAKGQIYVCR